MLADRALTRNETDRALNYSERLITALGTHPKPEGMAAPTGSETLDARDPRAFYRRRDARHEAELLRSR